MCISGLEMCISKTEMSFSESEKSFSKLEKLISELEKSFPRSEKSFSDLEMSFSGTEKLFSKPEKSISEAEMSFSGAEMRFPRPARRATRVEWRTLSSATAHQHAAVKTTAPRPGGAAAAAKEKDRLAVDPLQWLRRRGLSWKAGPDRQGNGWDGLVRCGVRDGGDGRRRGAARLLGGAERSGEQRQDQDRSRQYPACTHSVSPFVNTIIMILTGVERKVPNASASYPAERSMARM